MGWLCLGGLLRAHLVERKAVHVADTAAGLAGVMLPFALEGKYPKAGEEWGFSDGCDGNG